MHGPLPEQRIIRYKISSELAFPLGYELLEKYFGDLPQWPEFEFWFEDRPIYWASEFTKILKESTPYPLVCMRRGKMGMRAGDPSGFSLEIYPVKRELKYAARESFLIAAIEPFRQFIQAKAEPHRRERREAIFDPVAQTCTVRLVEW